MRIRVLGQFVPVSIAVLALVEGLIAFLALYGAVSVRYAVPLLHVRQLEHEFGPMWPRALVFASVVVVCLIAFGLYREREPRPPPSVANVGTRVAAAMVTVSVAMGAIYYLFPSLHLWRGVATLAGIFTGLAVLAARAVFMVGFPEED